MNRMVSFLLVCFAATGLALAQAPNQAAIQGLYEGTCKDATGELKIEARMVALGKYTYKLLIRKTLADGKIAKATLQGKTDGQAVTVAGKADGADWTGLYADGAIKGTAGASAFLLKRIERPSPTLGAKPPEGATVLLDGKNFDGMTNKPLKDGTAQQWKLTEGGAIEVPKGGMNTKQPITGSFKLHVEFMTPLVPAGEGQGRGNSGLYLPNGEEIQVLDSFGMTTYQGGCCGGLYRYKDPDAFDEFPLASLPPLAWQTYDVEYRVEKKDGKLAGKPKVTVLHNGVKIHDNVQIQKDARAGTLHFQDHGNPVQYRNVWMQPLE